MTKQKKSRKKQQNTNIVKAVTESAFMKEFREFLNRGSIVDLAIGVAVGGAFTSIANSLVNDVIMPIASLLMGGLDFSSLSIDVPNIFGLSSTAHIAYGNFLQNIVNFLVIAFTVFILVRTVNRLNTRHEEQEKEAAKDKKADEKTKTDESTKKLAQKIVRESSKTGD